MEQLKDDVHSAALSVAREWPEVIEPGDVEQEIWLYILERPNIGKKLEEMATSERHRTLRRIGHQIASEYRASYEVFSGNIYYGTKDVRRILEKVSNGEDDGADDPWLAYPTDSPGSAAHTEQMDLQSGLERLHDKNHLYAMYVEAHYFSAQSYHKHSNELTRAVDALTRCMNGARKNVEATYREQRGVGDGSDNGHDPVGANGATSLRTDVLTH